ncbi:MULTISPECIES: hypothetical protein [unclassified Streptomyces]|uniref:hypothetical protein n=1 Tax=unclassified Streptomyces TaxID=2593676 RepID=UPI0013CCE4D5|nr:MULTISPECIES: hypothetical protein [unclassified Streptomyces]NDZ84444.1 hypothetical protein [Streptomyces sp. SID10115]NEB43407.1 hypothetical protein [Streptomyces sp. SID339]
MDEPTNPQPRPDRPPPVIARVHLSPVQEAYGAWVHHQLGCAQCRDIDADPCPAVQLLRWRWEAMAREAIRRVADDSPPGTTHSRR